ncbi:hypothetical protein [Streptomyces regalis]|uniref:hypothetical protein n=1 Tax=Streptomyces regalis TaxID=68262 RepID=UPI00131DFCEC|nr:hypothetical protein [Streptomyces regalis]
MGQRDLGRAEGGRVILDGLDEALAEAARLPHQDTLRRRRTRIGWRQVTVVAGVGGWWVC